MEHERLGKYEIRGILGKGAMGTVYDGYDAIIDRRVAIKTMSLPDPSDGEAQDELARFRREAQAAGRLTHPNIVAVYDYGEDGKIAFIVMEYAPGTELKKILDKGERLPVSESVRIMDGLLQGLQYSHEKGVVHRDIKPGNVILKPDGTVKIADFGIARIESSSMTQAGTVMGTPAYMSPEQFMGQTVDARTDIYSSGVMLYQLLTGERPFEGGMTAIMHKALNTVPPAPSQLSVTAPPALDPVVARAMAKRPEDRFESAAAFAQAIRDGMSAGGVGQTDNLLSDEATMVSARRAPPADARPAPTPAAIASKPAPAKSRVPLLAGVAVAVLVAGGVGAFLLAGGDNKPGPVVTAAAVPQTSVPGLTPQTSLPDVPVSPLPATTATLPPSPPAATIVPQPPPPPPVTTALPPAPAVQANAVPPPQIPATPIVPQAAPLPPAATPSASATVTSLPPVPAATLPPVVTAPVTLPPPAPSTPPTVVPPPPVQTASIAMSPALVRDAVAAALRPGSCSLTKTVVDAGSFVVTGLAGRGVEGALRGAARAAISGNAPVDTLRWRVDVFDGPYCDVLDVVRPTASLPLAVSLLSDEIHLRKDQDIVPTLVMPDFPAWLQIDYFSSDGALFHMHPTAVSPSQIRAARSTVMFGNTAKERWQVDAPFGTDMILAIATSAPLFPTMRPADETKAAYLQALRTALDDAARKGVRIAVGAIAIQTAER